jgi:chemosensory pili system protein ChpA (sensor histidine kinase/response regulator)
LVADDNATERTALKEIFKRQQGWELIQANDGQDALDKLHAGLRPDLLLVDLRMPKLDGFGFIQRIREDANLRKLRVVVVSSDHDREQVRALAQLNIAGYLLKPFDEAKVKVTLLQATGIEVSQTPATDIIKPEEAPVK